MQRFKLLERLGCNGLIWVIVKQAVELLNLRTIEPLLFQLSDDIVLIEGFCDKLVVALLYGSGLLFRNVLENRGDFFYLLGASLVIDRDEVVL